MRNGVILCREEKKGDREESLSTVRVYKSKPVFRSVKMSGFLSWRREDRWMPVL